MEDNQVANGDPLKDLYTQFNPKLKLANSYEEFKSVMQDAGARKDFFNEFNSKLKLANDFNQFENVLGLKKKDGGIPSPTGLPASLPSQLPKSSVTGGLISYADDGQKAAVVQPTTITEKLFGNVRPERQQLDVTPKVRNVEKEIEVEQVGKKITSDAISNTLKAYKDRLSGDGTYNISDTDPTLINQKNDLEKDLKEGNLQVVKSQKTGQYILARKNGALQSISQAYNNVKEKEADDKYVASLSTIDKIKHYDNKAALVKDEYLPSQPSGFGGAFGTLIGENATPLVKMGAMATAAGKVGQYLGLTGTALANAEKFGSFLAFANDAGYSGYANNTEKVYNALRKQNPNGDKINQMQRAERAGLVGEVSGIATAGAMTGALAKLTNAAKNVNVQPLVRSLEQLAHHTVKESAIQGGFAAGGSIVSDLGAISQGVKMKPSEVIGGAFESGKGMVEFVAVMGSAMGIAAGFANVPKYVKAQATGILAKLNPVLVNDAYKEAEASGAAPIGTAEKAMQQINGFKEAQKKVPTDLPDENVNAISGIQQKIDKLEAQKKTLAPQFHDRIDAVIDSLRNRSKEIASSDKPLEKEVDDITQQPTNVRIEPAIPVVKEVKSKELEIPTDLEERGEPIESTLEAERRRSNGERIFAVSEQDEMPTEVTSIEMLRSYTPDQLIAYKPKEEVKPTEVNPVEQLRKEEQAELDAHHFGSEITEIKPTTTEVKSNKDVSKVFDMLLKDKDGSEDYGIHGLLADLYGGAEYNEDNGKITLNETRSGTGKMSITKKEFINDILSGKAEKEIPDAKEYINKVKQSIHDELGIKPEITPKLPSEEKKGKQLNEKEIKIADAERAEAKELTKRQLDNREKSRIDDIVDRVEGGDIKGSNISVGDKDLTEHLIDKGLDGREAYIVKDMVERLINPLKIITDKIDPQEVEFFTENTEDINSIVEGLEDARNTMFLRNKNVVDNVNKEAKRLLDYYSDKNNLSENTLDNEKTFAAKVDLLNKFLNGNINYLDLTKFGIEKKLKDYYKPKENAIQEPSTSSVLQYPQEGARETGGERGRVEPSKQGEAIAEKVKQVEGNEEEVKPKEYTSKTGRQKIVYDEKGNSKVIDTKTGKKVSRETAKKVFNEAADNYDFSKGKKASFEGAELKDEREVENYTIDNSSNPVEIAEVYARQELEPPILNSAETAIVNHGIGKVDVKSFKRFNDENNITFGLAKNWFQKGGKGSKLDAIAEEISAKTGVNVTPEDIGNFMVRFPSGARAEKLVENDIAYNARNKFEKLTGLPLTEEIAHKAIDYEFNKLTKEQQAIAEQDFKTRKQLEDAYWAEQPGAVKPAPEKGDNIATKQARKAEKGLRPAEGLQKDYEEIESIKSEKVKEKAKEKLINDNFNNIVDQLISNNKIKRVC